MKSVIIIMLVAFGGLFVSGEVMAEQHIGPPLTKELVTYGKTIYRNNCAACHGENLEGQPNWKERLPTGILPAPPHDESGHSWHHPDNLLFKITKFGGQPEMPEGMISGMPGFMGDLSDVKIWAVLSYIKSRWPIPVQARQRAMSEKQTQ